MKWNWDPHSWKRSTKVLVGIVTIWPVIYIVLFFGFIFSIFLVVPFAASRSNQSCGSIDVLQLDQKIKNGEIKKLTVRADEIVAMDRVGNCEYDVALANESTRRELVKDAREPVNGHPRVETIEEETARPAPASAFIPLGFAGLMGIHFLTMLLMMGLMPLYIILAVKNDCLDQTMRIIWVILVCLMGTFANPVYWYLYIWRRPTANPVAEPDMQA